MINEQVCETAIVRHSAMQAVRSYFERDQFIEIDSPIIINANCVEAGINPVPVQVKTSFHEKEQRYLLTSPEIALKKLLSAGMKKIFQLSHVFRDGEKGPAHLPEFCLLEWYRANGNLAEVINDCEHIIKEVANKVEINLLPPKKEALGFNPFLPLEKITMEQAWNKYAHIDLRRALVEISNGNNEALVQAVTVKGHTLREKANFEDAFIHIMLKCIEPNIGNKQACAIYNWPAQMASLARLCSNDYLFASRFEIYAGGLELANGSDELIDPIEQERRFLFENKIRASQNKDLLPIDRNFLKCLSKIPKAAGVAIGFDRLLMAVLKKRHIKEVMALNLVEKKNIFRTSNKDLN